MTTTEEFTPPGGPDWYVDEATFAWRVRRARYPDFNDVLKVPYDKTGMSRLAYRSAVAAALGLDATRCITAAAVECRGFASGMAECSYSELAKQARYMRAILASWDELGQTEFDGAVKTLVVLAMSAALQSLSDGGHGHLFTSLLDGVAVARQGELETT